MSMGGPQPGWYPDPHRKATSRWWDGYRWTDHTSGLSEGDKNLRRIVGAGALVLAIVGAALASFTQVSLLTGTSTVWVGVAIAVVGAAAAWIVRPVHISIKVIASILAAIAIASGVYDEVQLHHKREDLNRIVNGSGKKLSHTAVENYISANLGASGVTCNDGEDMPLDFEGETYECDASADKVYTVTITNSDTGDYTVK